MTIQSLDGTYELEAQGEKVKLKPLKGGLNFKRAIGAEAFQDALEGEATTVKGASADVFATVSLDVDKILVTLRFPNTPMNEVPFDKDDVELMLLEKD